MTTSEKSTSTTNLVLLRARKNDNRMREWNWVRKYILLTVLIWSAFWFLYQIIYYYFFSPPENLSSYNRKEFIWGESRATDFERERWKKLWIRTKAPSPIQNSKTFTNKGQSLFWSFHPILKDEIRTNGWIDLCVLGGATWSDLTLGGRFRGWQDKICRCPTCFTIRA